MDLVRAPKWNSTCAVRFGFFNRCVDADDHMRLLPCVAGSRVRDLLAMNEQSRGDRPMKALVVGGTGLVSTAVVRRLLARGVEVAIFNRGQRSGSKGSDRDSR